MGKTKVIGLSRTEYDGDPREREDRKRRLLCKKRGNKGKIRHEGGGEERGERIREGHGDIGGMETEIGR